MKFEILNIASSSCTLFVNNLSPSATALSYSFPITVYLKPQHRFRYNGDDVMV